MQKKIYFPLTIGLSGISLFFLYRALIVSTNYAGSGLDNPSAQLFGVMFLFAAAVAVKVLCGLFGIWVGVDSYDEVPMQKADFTFRGQRMTVGKILNVLAGLGFILSVAAGVKLLTEGNYVGLLFGLMEAAVVLMYAAWFKHYIPQ